jgi:hypothetical protein
MEMGTGEGENVIGWVSGHQPFGLHLDKRQVRISVTNKVRASRICIVRSDPATKEAAARVPMTPR